ncbi:SDR family NAD(P)-dependent oxidoreductase [Sphingomonas profundi]|uniref:SDR family NAD(P)-dependent oxidoreductase n=1 Tax=Alterirhizorhabdus profundi TaxID=2681549 RepID=UPI0018D163C4|nr:glucose 1-dehydrogenase [Sphingomonas profundi]
MMDLMLDGKIVLVTGGASGIGRAAALRFAAEGARVIVCDRSAEMAEDAAATIRADGGEAQAIAADVSDAGSVDALMAAISDCFGGLDIALNNAGIGVPLQPIADVPDEDYDLLMSINLRGVWLCMRREIPLMLARGGGAIVNTSSALGLVSMPTSAAYVASKHGVIGLTKTAALEYSAKGIRVNAVCPGVIETPLTREATEDPDARPVMLGLHPIGRLGRAEEVADAMLWLASPRASFITGVALPVDGGWTAH